MSRQLISRSPDLQRLRDEGYEIEVRSNHLLVKNVPYVNSHKQVQRGVLVTPLTLNGDRTAKPENHVMHFAGDDPCHHDGRPILGIQHGKQRTPLGGNIVVDRSFSNKPEKGFNDYYEKVVNYATIISAEARAIDPSATPQTFVVEDSGTESVFNYTDTASSRAGIGAVSDKLRGHKIAIVGLGGTGAYILDLVAKTPVATIKLIDGDRYCQHNAFRAPGAPTLEELRNPPYKATYYRNIYSRMHKGIEAHSVYLDVASATLIRDADFVFVCVDSAGARRTIINILHEYRKPFIDVGMGLELIHEQSSLIGMVRLTLSTPDNRTSESRIPMTDNDIPNEYTQNIQTAALNSLNAALAVIKWQKVCGFFQDEENEYNTTYSINVNHLQSDDSQRIRNG